MNIENEEFEIIRKNLKPHEWVILGFGLLIGITKLIFRLLKNYIRRK